MPGAFRKVWFASTASNVGDGIVLAALPLLAVRFSHDPVAVSGMAVAAALPWLLFGLLAGVFVDRTDRKRMMVAVDVARAVIMSAIAAGVVSGTVALPTLYLAVFLLGVCETLFDTAAQAVIPALVSMGDLERANGRLFGAQIVANQFIGPPLGGLLFGVAVALPFTVDAASFGLSAAIVATIGGSFRPKSTVARDGVAAELRRGLSWLWQHRTIRGFAIGAGVINIAYSAAMAILVLHTRANLGVGDTGFGLLLASAAIGSVAGTIIAAPVSRAIGRGHAVILSAVTIAGSLALIGLSSSVFTAGGGLALFGVGSEIWNVVAVSYRQAVVPDELLGRVMSSYRFIAYGSMPIGAMAGGAVAHSFGLRVPYLAGAGAVMGLLFYLARVLRGADLALTGTAMETEGSIDRFIEEVP